VPLFSQKIFRMKRLVRKRESSVKEIVIARNLIVVHKQQGIRQDPNEKCRSWIMPPHSERYIKHKKHDPL
jgi:hypothetical protein